MILGIFRISGHSMLPALKPNDRVVVSSIPYILFKPKKGDVVVFKFNSKTMVKRIEKIDHGKIFVEGDNKNDSLKLGHISEIEILGKVIYTLRV